LRLLYTLAHYLAVPLVLLHLVWRARTDARYLDRMHERFGCGKRLDRDRPTLWVHAVSVGEVQAAVPLVRALLEAYAGHRVLVTTTTPTGCERVRLAFGETVMHRYVPYDLPGAVNRFLDRVRPVIAIVLETELWPNTFHYCARRAIPILLANVRLSDRSARSYRRAAGLARRMLADVSAIAVQSGDDARRLRRLGAAAQAIAVTGSIKFDVRLRASVREEGQALRRMWGVDRDVWIAASTHEGEDEQVLDAFARVLRVHSNCLLVLVPRHPERFARVAALCRKRGYSTVLRSDDPESCVSTDIFIGDTMGELPVFYAASDVSFVGGSLIEIGGHNMLEPAALGVPVVFGPHVFNFAEISRRLCEEGAAVQVDGPRSLAEHVVAYLDNANLRHATGQKGKAFVDRNRGACDRVMRMVRGLIEG